MKLPLTVVTLLLSLIALTQNVRGQNTCSCKAPDASCTASVTCSKHGCTSICGPGSGCYAACGKEMLLTRFTLKLVNKDGGEIASALSRQTGRTIEFIPRKRSGRFSIDIKDSDMWATLDYLYERGNVKVDGKEWGEYQKLRTAIREGRKLSIALNNISVRDALANLSFVSGMQLRLASGNAEQQFSISLQEVTFTEVIARISAQTGVKIEQ